MSKCQHKSSGQTLVIFTLVIVTLLGAVALCADVAVLYVNWGQLQKCADAAAVAGAHRLPGDPTGATTVAAQYVSINGKPIDQILENQVGAANTTLTVKLQRTVPFFFARVLGFLNTPVTVQATAAIENAGGANGIFPIGLSCAGTNTTTDCGCNSSWGAEPPCVLHYGMLDGAPGNWEPLAVGANGANQLRDSIANGYDGTVTIDQNMTLPTEPGNMMGPIRQGMDIRLSNSNLPGSPAPTEAQLAPSDPSGYATDSRLVLVPEINYTNANGKTDVPVMGFAMMWISSFDPSTDAISVYFLKAVDPSAIAGGSGAPTSGPLAVTLIE